RASAPRQPPPPLTGLPGELALHRLKQRRIKNGLVLSAMNVATVDHLADIEAVLKQMGERADAEPPPADGPAGRQPAGLAANSPPVEVLRQRAHGAKLEIAGKDRANRFGLGRDHKDLLVHRGIAERDRAADPNALALGGSELVCSPISSRSNWAKDSSTLSVSRPMLELVLNDWVTETNETPWASNSSMSLAKSASERVSRSTLYTSSMSILPDQTSAKSS